MKKTMATAILCLFSSFLFAAEQKGDITIKIGNFTDNAGEVLVYLYNSADGFPQEPEKAVNFLMERIRRQKAEVTFKQVTYGTYAISVFHDQNSNKIMDLNWLGIPKEGYGISNDAKGLMGPPSFRKASFNLGAGRMEIPIQMEY